MKIILTLFLLNLNVSSSSVNDSLFISSDSLKKIAVLNAKKTFKNKKENAIVCIGSVVLTPVLGWVIPLYFQKKAPNDDKILIPKSIYSDIEEYKEAYKNEFLKIRKRRLWANYALTSVSLVFALIILYPILLIILFLALGKSLTEWFEGWFF